MLIDSRLWTRTPIAKANSVLDSGFQGIDNWLPNSITPFKKPRKSTNNSNPQLTTEQKWFNKTLAQERIKIENINREIKKFRICKEIRRQKQTKHDLFWKIVSGIVNFKGGY
jgi:DDE superfamily endonuclease